MIHLNGYKIKDKNNLNGDISILFTGMRKGEKIHENLFDSNDIEQSEHPRILKSNDNNDLLIDSSELEKIISSLEKYYNSADSETMIKVLRKYIS